MPRPISLLEALALVPDPRSRHGRIHPLVAVLGLVTVAMLAGCTSLDAIAQFGRDRGLPLAAALGFRRAKTPNKATLGKLFRRLDVAALELLGVLPLAGRVVTADALFTHRDVCDTITDAGGDDVLAVKDNQPALSHDIEQAFADPAGFSPLPAAAAG